jgi:DNA-binding XRE family transcriptional regulator
MLELGMRVRVARKEAGLSQEQLGLAIGLHRTHVGHIEQGRANPSMWTILLISRGLGIKPGRLLDDL